MDDIPFGLLAEFPTHADALREIERLRTALNNALRSQPNHACSTGFFPCWCEEARRG